LEKVLLKVQTILRERDEKTICLFDAVGRNPPEDAILGHALCRSFRIGYGIPPATVKKPMVSSGGTREKISFFDQQGRDSSQREISRNAHTCRTPSNDHHLRFNLHSKLQF
jgi:hypothetical protein